MKTYVPMEEWVNQHVANLVWFVKAEELDLLEGRFRPFNSKERVEVDIKHVDGYTIVTTHKNEVLLMAEDSFVLSNDGSLRLIKGPGRYENQFEKIIAASQIPIDKLKFDASGQWIPGRSYGVVPNMATKEGTWIKTGPIRWSPSNILIICNNLNEVQTIVVNEKAGEFEENFLIEFIESHDLGRNPSGAFEIFTKPLREKERLRLEREAEWAERSAAAEENRKFFALLDDISGYKMTVPKSVEVDGKKYTVGNRVIYRGMNLGGKKVDLRTLYDNGVLQKIVELV